MVETQKTGTCVVKTGVSKNNKRLVWPAFVVGLFSIIWMASDFGYVQLSFNVGPFAIFAVAIVLLINEYRD
jgi:hypothetical protein